MTNYSRLPHANRRDSIASIGGRYAEATAQVRAFPGDLPSSRISPRAGGRLIGFYRVGPIRWSTCQRRLAQALLHYCRHEILESGDLVSEQAAEPCPRLGTAWIRTENSAVWT